MSLRPYFIHISHIKFCFTDDDEDGDDESDDESEDESDDGSDEDDNEDEGEMTVRFVLEKS